MRHAVGMVDHGADEPAGSVAREPDAETRHIADRERPREAHPSTEVVQAVERRNWTRGISAGVFIALLLVGVGWAAGMLAALWQ